MPPITAPCGQRIVLGSLVALCFFPSVATAQISGDQVPRTRTVAMQEQVKLDMERSRFRLGPIRLLPVLEISEAGYDTNVFGTADEEPVEPVSDWSARVSAGVGWIIPAGSKLYVRGNVLPEYTWYREVEGRRNFGGLYDASLLAFLNRMSVEVGTGYHENLSFLNTETEARVVQQVQSASARTEIDLTRRVALSAGADVQRIDYQLVGEDPLLLTDVEDFERSEGAVRGGLRFQVARDFDISAVFEATLTDFLKASDRDNQTRAYVLGLHYSRPRLFVSLIGGYREGEPYKDSEFEPFQTPSGSLFLSYFLRPNLELRLHGSRGILYSIFEETGNQYYVQTRGGGGLNLQIGRRVLLRSFAEFGTSDYNDPILVQGELLVPDEPFRIFGGGFSLILIRNLVLSATASELEHESNIPGRPRTIFRVTTSLSFSGDFTR